MHYQISSNHISDILCRGINTPHFRLNTPPSIKFLTPLGNFFCLGPFFLCIFISESCIYRFKMLSHKEETKSCKSHAQCMTLEMYVHIKLNVIPMVVTLFLIMIKMFLISMSNETSVILKQSSI